MILVALEERGGAKIVTDVVHEDVESAELRHRAREPVDLRRLADVGHERLGPSAVARDLLDALAGALLVDVDDDDVRAGCGQGIGDRAADPAGAARDRPRPGR